MGSKSTWKKIWYFLWEEDSIWSWVANVILAFIIIKFLVYPFLGFVLGTPAPIVAVISGSMQHDGNFNEFWSNPTCCNNGCSKQIVQSKYYEELGISKADFKTFDFVNGFNKGDIMILYSPLKAEVGDVIVYVSPRNPVPGPIIHRTVKVEEENGRKLYWTKGDHNCNIGDFEQHIPQEQVIGKAVWRIPLLGYVKIIAVNIWGMFVR